MNLHRLLPVIATMAFTSAFAGPVPGSTLSVIQGKASNENVKKITLSRVVEGRKEEIATAVVNDQQAFAFAMPAPKEGFYYLSTPGFKGRDARIYLKGGEQLQLTLNGGDYTLQSGTPENKALHQWDQQVKELMNPAKSIDSSTYLSYFPKLEAFVTKMPGFKKMVNTPNKKFNELLKFEMEVDVEQAAMLFLLTPRTKHPKQEDYTPYYKQIVKDNKYNDARLLQSGDGADVIGLYASYYMITHQPKERPKPEERLANVSALFGNDSIKAVAITSNLSSYKTFEGLTEAIAPVQQYLVTDVQKARYLAYEKSLRHFAAGEAAINFSGEDINGKKVSLTDLKGKVVVVDVWATWCGPCKAEMPHLSKLEEEMEGKNVVFLGCSVDEAKDKQKWIDFVKQQEMKGIQIFVNGWSDITKNYDIKGIPRFMVFDQKGNIVNIDAPRPSTPELKALIEKTLTKG
ncbi:TlpA disulfide reductase family protein [Chitinophaga arvensicola]|uniref:Thiol-disulfide isomerase or thioredoxin n=1 Tax=Chitinophaga arvensicola TaxID=29529 RepID=A0A1I0P729_9BACT|nr:TlpA disulfide reductase family protein [Chitinophaga arvensicola]SEW10042.1 Thiol-disulfide isomerase or thioredoxin [Chitinophaga arvensicola]